VTVFMTPLTLMLNDFVKSAVTAARSFSLVWGQFIPYWTTLDQLSTYASCIVEKLLSSLTYAALLIRTSNEPPVIFSVSEAALFSASTSTISASNMWRLPLSPSFVIRDSVAALLRTRPITVLEGSAERCLMKAYCTKVFST
jgi:hypothetical protein